MKYHVVLDSQKKFRGYMTAKKDVKTFKVQRNMDDFYIVEIDADEPGNEKLIQSLKSSHSQIVYQHGFIMFPDEEEYFYLSFDQMMIDTYQQLGNIFQNCIPFVKYEKGEEEILDRFLHAVFQHMQEYEDALAEGADDVEITDRFFKVESMIKHIIKSFGGR